MIFRNKSLFLKSSSIAFFMFMTLFLICLTTNFFSQETQRPKKLLQPQELTGQEIFTIELFSFKSEDNQWHFSLFRGKQFGVMKEEEEIKNPSNTITLEEVLKRLESFPDNSIVIWRNLGNEAPPEEIQKKIASLCATKKSVFCKFPIVK